MARASKSRLPARKLGDTQPVSQFNPLAALDPNSPDFPRDVMTLAEAIIPADARLVPLEPFRRKSRPPARKPIFTEHAAREHLAEVARQRGIKLDLFGTRPPDDPSGWTDNARELVTGLLVLDPKGKTYTAPKPAPETD